LDEVMLGSIVSQEDAVSIEADFFRGRSLPLEVSLSKIGKVAHYRKQLPLQPGDALWLIAQFLDDAYPIGGPIDLSKPAVWPESNTIWPQFEKWLDTPLFRHHPQRLNLKGVCHLAKDAKDRTCIPSMTAALELLRPPITFSRREIKQGALRRCKKIATVASAIPAGVLQAGTVRAEAAKMKVDDRQGTPATEAASASTEHDRSRLAAERRSLKQSEHPPGSTMPATIPATSIPNSRKRPFVADSDDVEDSMFRMRMLM